MGKAAGAQSNAKAALQAHLGQLTTPQHQQLTVAALCRGVAARDPAWVLLLAQVVSSAPSSIQQHLAAQPGLIKDLAAYLALSSIRPAGVPPPPAAAAPSCAKLDGPSSSSKQGRAVPCSLEQDMPTQQIQQGGSSSSSALEADTTPNSSSTPQEVEAAATALSHLLQHCCGACATPSYQDLAPALAAALQQGLASSPTLATSILYYHASAMASDQPLLSLVLNAAEQGGGPAPAAVLAALAPQVLQALGPTHAVSTQLQQRVTALLAGGTAAGSTFLAAALLQEADLWEVAGMVEATCSGLGAACRHAAAVDTRRGSSSSDSSEYACLVALPPAHAVCLQYLRGVVDLVLQLAPRLGPALSIRSGGAAGPLVPALAEALRLLLEELELPEGADCEALFGGGQRPYHDAAWGALLALCRSPEAAGLVAALFQHQPLLCQALAASWEHLDELEEEAEESAARLAACLLLASSIPGQDERRRHRGLLVAAFRVWDEVSPGYWRGRGQLLLEIIRLPAGPAAVANAHGMWDDIFDHNLLGSERKHEGWALLLAAPDFTCRLLDCLASPGMDDDWHEEEAVTVVRAVLEEEEPALTQALLAIPGVGEALAQSCSKKLPSEVMGETLLGNAVYCDELQEYLAQQPVLLHALAAWLRSNDERVLHYWEDVAEDSGGDEWLLQQPWLLDALVDRLVMSRKEWPMGVVVDRLLETDRDLVCATLLRQPSILQQLLRVLAQRYWHPPAPNAVGRVEDTQLWLLEELAKSELAPQAMALLPGLLAMGDAQLSTGVFKTMHLMQRQQRGEMVWCRELAATSSTASAVQLADQQLAALRQGVLEVQGAAAAAAAATRGVQEQQQEAVAAAGSQAMVGDRLTGRRGQGNRRRGSHHGAGVQQQDEQGAVSVVECGSSSKRRGRCKAAADQPPLAAAGGKRRAGHAAAAAAVSDGGRGEDAGAPPPVKRTRR